MTKVKKMRRKETMSEAIRRLVLAGKTNAEIWKLVSKRFGLPEEHRWYPAWYRSDMVRRGLIGRREAQLHARDHREHRCRLVPTAPAQAEAPAAPA